MLNQPLPADLCAPVSKLLGKSFADIKYEYDGLTPQEQACITREQFQDLVLWLVKHNAVDVF